MRRHESNKVGFLLFAVGSSLDDPSWNSRNLYSDKIASANLHLHRINDENA